MAVGFDLSFRVGLCKLTCLCLVRGDVGEMRITNAVTLPGPRYTKAANGL